MKMSVPAVKQSLALSVMVGYTIDLVNQVGGGGVVQGPCAPQSTVPTWPDPVWASSDNAVATVAVGVTPNQAVVTGVALGTVAITATILQTTQRFIVDVVPFTPGWVTVTAPC